MSEHPAWARKRRVELVDELLREKTHLSLFECMEMAIERLVMKHEQPPVDPDVITVREIINAWHSGAEYHWGTRPPMDHDGFPEALAAYRKHKEAGEIRLLGRLLCGR